MKILLCYFLAVFLTKCANCSNILMIFTSPSRSHTILGAKLAEGLVKYGHQVGLISPHDVDPMRNLTHIPIRSVLDYMGTLSTKFDPITSGRISLYFGAVEIFKTSMSLVWKEPGIQKIIREKPKYDVVIIDNIFNDAMLGIPHHLGVPTILFSCVGSYNIPNRYMANLNAPYIGNPFLSNPSNSFPERLLTVTVNMIIDFFNDILLEPTYQALLKEYLPNVPPLRDLKKNVSLMLLNSHISIEPPRPYLPNMIQIGGFHVQGTTKKLPKDIQDYLDSAKDGAILFALGSNVQVSSIEEEKRAGIFKVLGEMAPMKVLLKSDRNYEDIPKNILIKQWIPQVDILAHSNVRALISHGGLGGITEAVYHGVPIMGLPFGADQNLNMDYATSAGYGVKISYHELNEESFKEKLKEIIHNPSYREKARIRSALMKGQPVKPMETAVFWIEHIIKYGGGRHLRNDGMDLTWYQLYMIDIYAFYSVVIGLLVIINYWVLNFFWRKSHFEFSRKLFKIKRS